MKGGSAEQDFPHGGVAWERLPTTRSVSMRKPLLFRATTTFLQRLLAVAVLAAWLFPMGADGQIAPTGTVRGKVLAAGAIP